MAARIVLFGATGYTGRLVADGLVERGVRPVLAARGRERLEAMAAELGGLETALADVADPASVRALVERGDVLVTTVGPFSRWGAPAAEAASSVGAHYIDSTGEPAFIRAVFERHGAVAQRSGSAMLTAFGYDWVPGNFVGALALDRAGAEAVRVDIGYFVSGKAAMSGGTMASTVGAIADPSFAFRDGAVRTERGAKRVRGFQIGSKKRDAVSVGSSEHFALPRVAPQLREVNVYLGWFGPLSRPMQVMSLAGKLPGAQTVFSAVLGRVTKSSSGGGPDAEARSKSGSRIVGEASDAEGNLLSRVLLRGPNGYTFTGDMLAWAAHQASAGALQGVGALGPANGFGLRALEAGCAEVGLKPV
jgi:short subunit dehydrogenase-like uncharacterized protein